VHVHDWQGGLTPAYLKLTSPSAGVPPPTLLTVHNIAFQGLFPASAMAPLGLPARGFTAEGFEFFGQVGFLKAGLAYADRITTVSPTYARELATPEYGMGLEGLIAHRRADLTGILNGIDLAAWDPAHDVNLAAPYSAAKLSPKAKSRKALAARFRLQPNRAAPLFCVISRLTRQKGLDLLLAALPRLLARGAQLAVLGTGDADLEAGFAEAARDNPGRVGVVIGYDEPLSHLMQGGADAILVPSRFEPCPRISTSPCFLSAAKSAFRMSGASLTTTNRVCVGISSSISATAFCTSSFRRSGWRRATNLAPNRGSVFTATAIASRSARSP